VNSVMRFHTEQISGTLKRAVSFLRMKSGVRLIAERKWSRVQTFELLTSVIEGRVLVDAAKQKSRR